MCFEEPEGAQQQKKYVLLQFSYNGVLKSSQFATCLSSQLFRKMDPMNGRTVNKIYKIGDMIGIGNNGEIYEGINDDTDEKVAVKLEPLYEISDHLLSERLVYCTLGLQGLRTSVDTNLQFHHLFNINRGLRCL